MRLAYAFVPGDAIVEVSTEGDFLGRAEEKVHEALGIIKSGRFEPTPSRYACSHCPVMGVGLAGCPMEVPEEWGEYGKSWGPVRRKVRTNGLVDAPFG